VNSREGGISIDERGRVKIVDGIFLNNTAESIKYPSFRHNILCLNGELNIESLKGGDGKKENSSLFISSSADCVVEGIVKNLPSPLFIPSISSIDEPNEENNNQITFNGIHLFPCSLSLSFSSDGIHPIESLSSVDPSFIDENSLSYSLSSDEIIQLNDFPLVYSSLQYLDHLNLPHLCSPFLMTSDLAKIRDRSLVEFCYLLGWSRQECYQKLLEKYGRESASKPTVYTYYSSLESKTFTYIDPAPLGESFKEELINKVSETVGKNPFLSLRKIADLVDTNKDMVRNIVINVFRMKKRYCQWVPHTLTEVQKQIRVSVA
jgi:hypothetical protein